MNIPRRIFSGMCILILFLLSGCAERPFLAKGGSYSIVSISPEGTVQKTPIQLAWNSNLAVMQQLLLEASFVLGDLHSLSESETSKDSNQDAQDSKQPAPVEATLLPSDQGEVMGDYNSLLMGFRQEADTALSDKQDLLYQEQWSQRKFEDLPAGSKGMTESPDQPTRTIMLEATFPEPRPFQLLIDDKPITQNVSSVQIEVMGNHPGLVIINEDLYLQGIPNPNLTTAFNDFLQMLQKTDQVPARNSRNSI